MIVYLGGIVIPKPTTFVKLDTPNETENITAGGTLYADFRNNRRTWTMGWKLLKSEDYDRIYTLYKAQYTNHQFYYLQFPAYSLYVPVKINISQENIRYNGGFYENFSITLKEKYPFS